MITPIPPPLHEKTYFDTVYRDCVWAQDLLADFALAGRQIAVPLTQQTRLPDGSMQRMTQMIYADALHDKAECDRPHVNLFSLLERPPNVLCLVDQSVALNRWRQQSPEICEMAGQLAAAEILDNDHCRHYQTKRSAIYPITSLMFDLVDQAMNFKTTAGDLLVQTPDDLETHLDALLPNTYQYQLMYSRMRTPKPAVLKL